MGAGDQNGSIGTMTARESGYQRAKKVHSMVTSEEHDGWQREKMLGGHSDCQIWSLHGKAMPVVAIVS